MFNFLYEHSNEKKVFKQVPQYFTLYPLPAKTLIINICFQIKIIINVL